MSLIRVSFLLGVSLCLLLSLCHGSAAQDAIAQHQQPSQGSDTSHQMNPDESTTKKPGFFKGIKNWFKGTPTTSTPSPSTPLKPGNGAANSIQPQPTPYVRPLSPPLSTTRVANQTPRPNAMGSGQTLPSSSSLSYPLPSPPVPVGAGGRPLSGMQTTAFGNNRDLVYPNVKPAISPISPQPVAPAAPATGPRQPSTLPSGPNIQPPQGSTNRDFVNPNVKPGNLPLSPMPASTAPGQSPGSPVLPPIRPSSGGQPSTGDKAFPNVVNPNVRPGTVPIIPQSGLAPASPTATIPGSSGQRDFVNPNVRPGGSAPLPASPSIPKLPSPSQPTGIRDFVNTSPRPVSPTPSPGAPSIQSGGGANPWGNAPQLPAGQPNSNPPSFNKENFPPLPAPGRPGSPNPPRNRPSSPNTNPSRPGVSFIPGQSTTPKVPELATDDEITALTEQLFTKDVNNQQRYITINYQGQTRSSERTDEAPNPFLQVDEQALQSPTVAKMKPLFNNYELDTAVNEYVTPMERKEENDLLDVVLATSVMRQAMLFLQNKGLVTPDPKTHRDLLKTIWFTLYSRGGGRIGSSAFEHVFLSEVKNGTVTGLHNWVYYFEEERQGHIDYKGYIKKLELGNKGAIVKFRFNFNGIEKPVNSMFIGTSPELELALYTICFELRADRVCPISLNGNRFVIQTYTFRYRGKKLIGSAYPEI